MAKDYGRAPSGQALAVPATPASAVDGSTGFDPSRLLFSQRMRVRDAIADPATVLPRGEGEGWLEEYEHWQTRAALQVVAQIHAERAAIATEAGDAQ